MTKLTGVAQTRFSQRSRKISTPSATEAQHRWLIWRPSLRPTCLTKSQIPTAFSATFRRSMPP